MEQHYSSSSRQQSNIISIVGFGGLGKTTLANSLLQDLKEKFDCHIFVSISLNPDIKKIFKNILLQLEDKYSHLDEGWEMKQLIDRIIELLKDRRYNFNYTYSPSSFVNISFPFGVNDDKACSNWSFQVSSVFLRLWL